MNPGIDVKDRRPWLSLRYLAVFVALAVLASAIGLQARPAAAQDFPSEISGKVVNGTSGATVPPGTDVVLLVVDDSINQIIDTASQVVGTNGEFTFTDLLSGPGLSYRVAADDGSDYTPSVDLIPGESSFTDIELTIYESTQSFDDIRLSTFSMLITGIERANRLMGVLGVISVVNSGDMVWIPDLENPQLTGLDLLRFNLPEGYQDLTMETTLPSTGLSDTFFEIPTGFALANPVPPGESEILITYTLDYEGDTLAYPLRLAYGADLVRLMIPKDAGTISGLGLGDMQEAVLNDDVFSVVDGRNYERGSQLDVQFTALPTPNLVESIQQFVNGRGYLIAIAWIAGAAMLGILVYAFFFARQRTSAPDAAGDESYPEYAGLGRSDIVATIAELDRQHDAGEIEEDNYNKRRSVLTKAALSAPSSEPQAT